LLNTVLSAFLVTGVAACSSDGPGNEGTTTPPKPTTSTQETVKSDPIKKYTISALNYSDGKDMPQRGTPAYQAINEKYNIDYQITFIPTSGYEEKLSAVLASGDIPDILGLQGGELKGRYYQFAKQGAFLPLDDYIKDYPTLKMVPDYIWDALRVNGKIYAVPKYFPIISGTTIIRKDWLDNLNLSVPKSYEELKKVAIAFTKNDPDKNGKADTYGVSLGAGISPNYSMGAYWSWDAWYHKDKDGNFIPGLVSPGRKEMIQFFADLNKEGALTKDYATMNAVDFNKEFYSGQAGIFIGAARGMSTAYMEGLLKLQPNAKFVALEPFVAPDGSQGFLGGRGFGGLTVLSANLSKEPDKRKRVLEMIDFGRKYYSDNEKTPANKDYDFLLGKENVGYTMENGKAVPKKDFGTNGLSPVAYFVDGVNWLPPGKKTNYKSQYPIPQLADLVDQIEQMNYKYKLFTSPVAQSFSKTEAEKSAGLNTFLIGEQVKMIAGQRPISDWDKIVDEWKEKGGAQIIKEMNEGVTNKDAKSYFKLLE
jgi:putative aldouronate transport system substrate-binding protein